MKWWGWLVIAFGGSISWTGLTNILWAIDWIDSTNAEEVVVGGVIIICSGCAVIPLVQKAIKAAKEDK